MDIVSIGIVFVFATLKLFGIVALLLIKTILVAWIWFAYATGQWIMGLDEYDQSRIPPKTCHKKQKNKRKIKKHDVINILTEHPRMI